METLIFLVVVCYFAKFGVEDLSFAVRGKQSPRMAARAARAKARAARSGGGPARNYASELWSDAWASARSGHRRRLAARQSRPPKPPRPTGAARTYLRNRVSDAHAGASRRWAAGWDRMEAGHQRRHPPTTDDTTTTVAPVAAVPVAAANDGPEPAPAEVADDDTADTTQTPDAEPSGTATPTTAEGDNTAMASPNGEVTGLQSAIAYAEGLADELEQVPAHIEQLQAGLQAGEVGEGVIQKFANIGEHTTAAAAASREGAAELRTHLQVTEAYHSTGNQAGSKEFVTNE